MSLSSSMYSDTIPFTGRGGFGFNRRTWNAGNAIGRAAKPYVKSLYDRVVGKTKSSSKARESFRSRSRRRRGTEWLQQVPTGGGESYSKSVTVNPKIALGIAKQLLGVNCVNRNNSQAVSCGLGLQQIQLLGDYFNVADIQNAFTIVNQTAAGYNSGRIAFQTMNATHELVNASSTNMHATIYDCIARFDGSDINPDPVTVLKAGGVDATGGAALDYLIPGATPYNNPRFTSAYKIVKTTPIILSSGQIHCHRVTYGLNKIVNKERLIASDSAGPVGGITMYTFIVFSGTPVHDAASEATVTKSIVKLDSIVTEGYTFRLLLVNSDYNSILNSLPITMTNPEQWEVNNPTDTAAAT